MVITLGANAYLNIETQQAQTTVCRQTTLALAQRVDPWVAQANGTLGSQASQHSGAAYLAARSLAISWSATCKVCSGPPDEPMSKRYLPFTTMLGTPVT